MKKLNEKIAECLAALLVIAKNASHVGLKVGNEITYLTVADLRNFDVLGYAEFEFESYALYKKNDITGRMRQAALQVKVRDEGEAIKMTIAALMTSAEDFVKAEANPPGKINGAKAGRKGNPNDPTKIKKKTAKKAEKSEKKESMCGYIDGLILLQKYTAADIAKMAAKKFGRDIEVTLRTVRVRPSHMRAKGVLENDTPPFTDSKVQTGKMGDIRELLDGELSVDEIAEIIINKHGGELRSTKQLIRTATYAGRKAGKEFSYKLVKRSKADKVKDLTSKKV